MKAIAIIVGILVTATAATQESDDQNSQPSVEILGVNIVRGMPESEVRAAFPSVHCAEENPVDLIFDYCAISDGEPPGADGEVTFKEGIVHNASRNWFIPDGADPLEVLMMLNDILTRLIGEDNAVCAKVTTYDDQEPSYTIFALPEKVLTIQMHTMYGRTGAHFRESLRVNPVPGAYKTRGKKMQGTEWCAYAN